jgi:hypothetical protein
MKTLLILLTSVLFLPACAALRANEVRIYAGTIKHDFFYYSANLPQTQGLYVVHEPGTSKLTFIFYDRKSKSYTTETDTATLAGIVYPYSTAISGQFRFHFTVDASDGTRPVSFHRLRSIAKPVVTPVSSSTSLLLARSFAYYSQVWEPAVDLWENTGTITYKQSFTIERNNAGDDLNAAVNAILDHLRSLHYLN